MKFTFDTTTQVHSQFIIDEYFPAILEYSKEELNNHFIVFSYKDTDMAEFSVHPNSHTLKRFSLTLCNHYEIKEEPICIPPCPNGTITITGPVTTECKMFLATVYIDGLQIILSDTPASRYFRTGQMIFAFSEENELTSLYLTNLTEKEVSHIKNELFLTRS